MARRRRDRHVAPMSFFSFQDIVTSVTGILILLTLLMTLELMTRAQVSSAPVPTAATLETLNEAIADAEQQRVVLQVQVSNVRRAAGELASLSPLNAAVRLEKAEVDHATAVSAKTDAQRSLEKAKSDLASAQATLRKKLADAEQAKSRLQNIVIEQEHLKKSNTLAVLVGEGTRKAAWIVECAQDRLRVGRPDDEGMLTKVEEWSGVGTAAAFAVWSARRPKVTEYFVIMVRPDAVELSDRVIASLSAAGFDIGWEAVPNDVVLFPDPKPE